MLPQEYATNHLKHIAVSPFPEENSPTASIPRLNVTYIRRKVHRRVPWPKNLRKESWGKCKSSPASDSPKNNLCCKLLSVIPQRNIPWEDWRFLQMVKVSICLRNKSRIHTDTSVLPCLKIGRLVHLITRCRSKLSNAICTLCVKTCREFLPV